MAAPMFCPAGAEFDSEDDDDEFVLDEVDVPKRPQATLLNVESQLAKSNVYRGGFGNRLTQNETRPSVKKKPPQDPKALGMDDVRAAAQRGNLEVLKKFVDEGFDVNTFLKCGWTALMYAASSGDADMVEYLLDHGANPNAHKDMYTVLMAACGSSTCKNENVHKCVQLLLKHGAKVNAHDRYHLSPFIYAAREGRVQVLETLLDAGADINKQDSRGWTALSWSVSRQQPEAAQYLLDHKADPTKKHTDNQSILNIVEQGDSLIFKKIFGCCNEEISLCAPIVNGIDSDVQALSLHSINDHDVKNDKILRYGELELFLCGLDLSGLIPVFRHHKIEFETLLVMTDEDLLKMNINQLGIRKKLLDGIQAVHKKEWERSSLPQVAYNKHISCADAVAIVANISKHMKYIYSTIGYIKNQIKAQPLILKTQDGSSPKLIYQHCQDSLQHVQVLQSELIDLKDHLQTLLDTNEYNPPDLIQKRKLKKSKRKIKYLTLAVLGAGVLGLCCWKRQTIAGLFVKL